MHSASPKELFGNLFLRTREHIHSELSDSGKKQPAEVKLFFL